MVKFLAQALFSPRASTLIKAVQKNFLSSFPGLTTSLIDKHLALSVSTESGHLHQEKQHLQSTSKSSLPTNCKKDFFPQREEKTGNVIYALTTYNEKEVVAADLTGCFPYRSSRGHQYVMVMYHYDTNVI